MNSPARLLQKKSADKGRTLQQGSENSSAFHTWERTGKSHNLIFVCLAPRSLRYLISTPLHHLRGSRASLGEDFTPGPHLHCLFSAHSPRCLAAAQRCPPQSLGLGPCSAPAKAACLALTQGNLNPVLAKGSWPWEVPPGGRAPGGCRPPPVLKWVGRRALDLVSWRPRERGVPPTLTHPPGLLHVAARQPLYKVNAGQRRARGGQQDGGVHHEILHVHGLHLEGETL